jgi:predicted regulator of Ras-like GTPase activity (Roadblock/LC7/MglB family)
MLNKVLIPLEDKFESSFDKDLITAADKEELILEGDSQMDETLEELKKIMKGVIGSFVIDEKGEVAGQDLPKIMADKSGKTSKLIHYVTSVMKASRPLDRIIIDSENVKIVTILFDRRIFVVFADKDINLPLLKLVANVTVSRLKGDTTTNQDEMKMSVEEINDICIFYDMLFKVAANKLIEIFGSEAAQMFEDKTQTILSDHPKLLGELRFDSNGKPKIAKLKMNAVGLLKDELISGLEDLLVIMLETLKNTAGPNIADKAIDEIIKIKEKEGIET